MPRLMLDVFTAKSSCFNNPNAVVIAQTDVELVCGSKDKISYGIGMEDDHITISGDGRYFFFKADGTYRIDFTATLIPITDVDIHLEYKVANSDGVSLDVENPDLIPLLRTKLPQRFGGGSIQVNTFTVLPLKAGNKLSTTINSQREKVIIPEGARLLITRLS